MITYQGVEIEFDDPNHEPLYLVPLELHNLSHNFRYPDRLPEPRISMNDDLPPAPKADEETLYQSIGEGNYLVYRSENGQWISAGLIVVQE